jgi:hypothetical protein
VDSDQARDRQSRLRRVADQAISKWQRESIDTQNRRRLRRLFGPFAMFGVSSRLTVAEIDEQHRSPLSHQLRGGAAHDRFEVVWMCGEGEDVVWGCDHASS